MEGGDDLDAEVVDVVPPQKSAASHSKLATNAVNPGSSPPVAQVES